jgi:hypothetical protein
MGSTTKKTSSADNVETLASTVAPEDLRCGDFVAIRSEIVEWPSFLWCDSAVVQPDELVRIRQIPAGSGMPLKVKAVCLPFVLARSPLGNVEILDVRRVDLARLDERYAKAVRDQLRKKRVTGNGVRVTG